MAKKFNKICCVILATATIVSTTVLTTYADDVKDTTIHIVHTNDMHGYYTATNRGQIGFAALKKIIEQEDADLVLDIGDTFHGQSFATVEQGKSIAELMDEVGYDAMTPGNHDWSYGAERVKELDDESNFKVLAANVVTDEGKSYFDNSYFIKDVVADDGTNLKVGVVGVIDDRFYSSTSSANVKGIKFEEEAAKANEVAKILREDENCDIVLAITHQADCESFVSNISGIDAVLAGHEHILMDKDYTDKDGKQVKIVEANCFFQNVGVLSLTYDKNNGVVDITEKFYSSEDTQEMFDESVENKITEIESREQSVLGEVIGTSSKEYPYSWEEIRVSEQEIGRIITAAYLDYTGADVAMENAGGIRGGILAGDVTYSNLISISPYGNVLVEKELTGQQIVDILEQSLEINKNCDEVYAQQKELAEKGEDPYQIDFPSNSGSAFQFGGITAEYDMTKPYGERTSNIKIGGVDIDFSKTYRVVTNNYAAEDTEYASIAEAPLVKEYTTCEQILRSYIAKGNFEEAAASANIVPASSDKPTNPSESSDEPSEPANPNESSNEPSEPSQTNEPTNPNESDGKEAPKTSDNRYTAEILILVISSAAIAGFTARKKLSK